MRSIAGVETPLDPWMNLFIADGEMPAAMAICLCGRTSFLSAFLNCEITDLDIEILLLEKRCLT